MSATEIDLDDEALAEVMRIANIYTKEDAVNLAMRDYVERFRRIEALTRSREQAKNWNHEGWSRDAQEGARRDEHPLITFRDGPTGRRAGVISGPDVWEIVMWIDDLGPVNDPAAELISDRPITRAQVDAALAYYAAYPEEIQPRIDLHRQR